MRRSLLHLDTIFQNEYKLHDIIRIKFNFSCKAAIVYQANLKMIWYQKNLFLIFPCSLIGILRIFLKLLLNTLLLNLQHCNLANVIYLNFLKRYVLTSIQKYYKHLLIKVYLTFNIQIIGFHGRRQSSIVAIDSNKTMEYFTSLPATAKYRIYPKWDCN